MRKTNPLEAFDESSVEFAGTISQLFKNAETANVNLKIHLYF
jgi:hypothetical protein